MLCIIRLVALMAEICNHFSKDEVETPGVSGLFAFRFVFVEPSWQEDGRTEEGRYDKIHQKVEVSRVHVDGEDASWNETMHMN